MDLKNLFGKVSNIVVETGKQVGSVVSEKTKDARDYAKDAVEIARLKNDITSYKDSMKESYVTLGQYYYNHYEENPNAEVVGTVEAIKAAEESIKELEARIEDIKTAQAELKAAKQTAEQEEAADAAEAETSEEGAVDDELAKVKENVDKASDAIDKAEDAVDQEINDADDDSAEE